LAWKHLKAATVGGMVIAGRAGFQNKVWASMRQPQNDAGEIIPFSRNPRSNTPPEMSNYLGTD
jgi:hypothetical protein